MKKTKYILKGCMIIAGALMYVSMTSSSTGTSGVVGAAVGSGCGGCHGASNNSTSITLQGLPNQQYVPGQVYTLTLIVNNPTKVAAGFDLITQGGFITNNPTGTVLIGGGSELHHIVPKTLNNGSANWSFNWTAPNTPNATIRIAANAVNNNSGTSGDQWNSTSIQLTQAPLSTDDLDNKNLTIIYPNPSASELFIQADVPKVIQNVHAISLNGTLSELRTDRLNERKNRVDISALSPGRYMLIIKHEDGELERFSFNKISD